MDRQPIRRWASLGALTMLASTLLAVGAPPAGAAEGCTDETPPPGPILGLPTDGCDDSTPPETTVAASVTPNANGLVNVSTVTFALASVVTDGDPGPFGFECKVSGGPQAHDWQPCLSSVTLTGLPDAPAGSYVFEARAVDLGDSARNPDAPLGPGTVVDTPDVDQTPVRVVWGQDTKAPFVFVTGASYDETTPTQPVVTTDTVPIRINSNEPGSTFECTDDETPVACSGGRFELAGAAAGRHAFRARTVDRAGNASAWSEPIEFFVPRNVTTRDRAGRKSAWTTVRDAGYFRGDALRTTRRGAKLVLPRTQVGELRLVAPTGPGLGKVRIRVGKRDWHVVDLAGKRSSLQQLVVIDRYSGMRTGRIVIESLSTKPVVVDAVVARPNKFPPAHRA